MTDRRSLIKEIIESLKNQQQQLHQWQQQNQQNQQNQNQQNQQQQQQQNQQQQQQQVGPIHQKSGNGTGKSIDIFSILSNVKDKEPKKEPKKDYKKDFSRKMLNNKYYNLYGIISQIKLAIEQNVDDTNVNDLDKYYNTIDEYKQKAIDDIYDIIIYLKHGISDEKIKTNEILIEWKSIYLFDISILITIYNNLGQITPSTAYKTSINSYVHQIVIKQNLDHIDNIMKLFYNIYQDRIINDFNSKFYSRKTTNIFPNLQYGYKGSRKKRSGKNKIRTSVIKRKIKRSIKKFKKK